MNRKFTDEAADAAATAIANVIGHGMREKCTGLANAALEAAMPHLQPAKPEAVRLRDELLERAEFEAWAKDAELDVSRSTFNTEGYKQEPARFAWYAWQAALAATGKQQVGEVQGVEGFDIDDVRELFEKHAKGRDLTPDTWGVSSYVDPFVDNDWNEWVAAWKALAARQPVGQVVLYQVRQEIVREDSLGSSNGIVKERLNAWRDISKSHYDAYLSVMGGCGPTGVLGNPDGPVALELNQYAPKTEVRALYATPPAQAVYLGQTRAIEMLLTVAEAAYNLGDNASDMEDCGHIEYADFIALSDALDALDGLPDDQPGYTMTEPAKARWALRALIASSKAVGNG